MKTILKIIPVFLFSLLFSCENNEQEINEQNQINENVSFKILEEQTSIDDLVLPSGTKIFTISESQIEIELPKDFQFLMLDKNDEVFYTNKSSYSCTCSADNSCKVIYTSSEGYGCLQNSCTGSCTGKPTDGNHNKVYGVLNTQSKELLAENFIKSGHLTPKGYEIFFKKIAKNELIKFFDFVFLESDYKNSTELIANKGIESTSNVVLQFMGISFSAVVPNFDDKLDSQLINFTKGPTVSCAGSNGCSCTSDKFCIFGNCVYYCDGCTTCTMTVEEK
tara:strand:- start:94011 stop:94844 length:834 start_codon:yes stop_codon:yes gene_type:complete